MQVHDRGGGARPNLIVMRNDDSQDLWVVWQRFKAESLPPYHTDFLKFSRRIQGRPPIIIRSYSGGV